MPTDWTHIGTRPLHVSIVALPDDVASTLFGIFDVMNAFALTGLSNARSGANPPFDVEIVGETAGSMESASRVPITVQRAISTVESSDIVIVPSVLLQPGGWRKGRYPRLVRWLQMMHQRGAVLCSACSGIFLLAETGLFDGKDVTVHFDYARAFAATFPAVRLHPERVLMISRSRSADAIEINRPASICDVGGIASVQFQAANQILKTLLPADSFECQVELQPNYPWFPFIHSLL